MSYREHRDRDELRVNCGQSPFYRHSKLHKIPIESYFEIDLDPFHKEKLFNPISLFHCVFL